MGEERSTSRLLPRCLGAAAFSALLVALLEAVLSWTTDGGLVRVLPAGESARFLFLVLGSAPVLALPAAAAVFSELMTEPRNTPCSQLFASAMSGTVVARRPPNKIAEIGTP